MSRARRASDDGLRGRRALDRPSPRARRRPGEPFATKLKPERRGPARSDLPVTGPGRALSLLAVIMVIAALLISRLVFWQVMEHGTLTAAAAAEHAALDKQMPMRGRVFDADGNPLATDVSMNLVYAVPHQIKEPLRTAALLAPVLHQPATRLYQLFVGDAGYVPLAPRADVATSQKIRNLALPGVVLDPVVRRSYPNGSMAAQTLGFVTNDGKGYYGLEGYYDHLLAGTAGLRGVLKDTAGNDIHISNEVASAPQDGGDLHLTLDGVVQGLVEDELKKAVKQHHADGGTIIVMNPNTGAILGLAGAPGFDPNHYWTADRATYSNPAAGYLYEPGSTFKVVTMAAGLDSHAVKPSSAFYDAGTFTVGDTVLHNWSGGGFGWENMTQVLQHSANVGASWVAQHLGVDRFYRYVKAFGIGKGTGVDLQGEQSGLLPLPGSKSWTIVNLYTNSFGQGLAVTPLQLLSAVNTIANGGKLMKPRLVNSIIYQGRIIDRPPVVQGHPISRRTSRTLTNMLVHSAIGGEAAQGLVHGYNIAAKTGTANVAGPNGQYIPGDTIASITGYAPAYRPRFSALVIINHPRDTPWGSEAAAPVLHDIFQELFMYYHIPPSPHALYQ